MAFYFSAGVLDKVWKINKDGKAVQAAINIPQANQDINDFKEAMKRYGITYSGPMVDQGESERGMYDLEDPSFK